MPSQEQRVKIIQGLLDSGISEQELGAAVESLNTPELQNTFFTQAAAKLGVSYSDTTESTQPKELSAQTAFESGNPRAKLVTDTGKEQYAQPVSGPAALAVGGLKGATSVPFAYSSGAEDILSKTTGQSPEAAQQFAAAAEEQHPYLTSAGEFGGSLIGAPKLAGEALVSASVGAARGIKALVNAIEGGALTLTSKFAGKIGLPSLQKAATILKDTGSAGSPAILRKSLAPIEEAQHVVGKNLESVYSDVSKAIPKQMLAEQAHTRGALASNLETTILQRARERGEQLSKDFYPALKSEIDNIIGDNTKAIVDTTQKWRLAQQVEKRGKIFSRKSALPADETKADILNRIHIELRSMLSDDVSAAASILQKPELIQTVESSSSAYAELAKGANVLRAKLRTAQKPEQIQAAADRAAQILSYGPDKLGKYYKTLQATVARGLPAVANKISFMLHNDDDFAALLDSLENTPTAE